MQLALTVFFAVLVVTVLLGVAGYLIDRSADDHERAEGR
jgi:hypothetical protein